MTGRLYAGRKRTEPQMKGSDAVVLILEPAGVEIIFGLIYGRDAKCVTVTYFTLKQKRHNVVFHT